MESNLPVEARLARLEATVRRGRMVAALGIAAAFLLGAAKPGISGSEGASVPAPFSVVDSSGKTLFWVGKGPRGQVLLEVTDGNGGLAARLQPGNTPSSSRLTLFDAGRSVHYPR